MSALTDYAKGKDCMIRVPGYCTFKVEETVACHVPLMGYHGTGLKMPDLFIAFGCGTCHAIVDRSQHIDLDDAWVRGLHLEGMIRTQAYILKHNPMLLANYAKRAA